MGKPEPLMTLGQMRKRRGATMQDMAEAIGVTRWAYSGFEKNPHTMTVKQVEDVCHILRCSPEDLSDVCCFL